MRVILPLFAASTVFLSGFSAGVPPTDPAAELLDNPESYPLVDEIAAAPRPDPAKGEPTGRKPAAAPAAKSFDDSAFKVSVFKPLARSARRLDIEYVSPWVDGVTILPGERFPLRALSPGGKQTAVTWRAKGGTVAYGDKMAVWTAPLEPGAYALTGTGLVAGRQMTRTLQFIVTVPTSNVKGGKLNGYPIGNYPKGFGPKTTSSLAQVANRGVREDDPRYVVPHGFVELTRDTARVPLSSHYTVGDFQGKDGAVAGKKYLFVEPRLVEKLERLIATLNGAGYPCGKLEIMSGFRSPQLNKAIGNVTSLSRHTYGDAADVLAQDFNRDGKVDVVDGQILLAAVTKLDKETDLVGGASLYSPGSGHGYFVHTDTRGSLVRW